MKLNLKRLVGGLALAFSTVACESKQDIADKPAVAETMVQASLQTCPTASNKEDYIARLNDVLQNTYTKNLETIRDNNITVCLDQRLFHQDAKWYEGKSFGVFYPSRKIVGLWDNGVNPQDVGILDESTTQYGLRSLNRLGEKIRDNDMPQDQEVLLAHCYGKGCQMAWDKGTSHPNKLAKNPTLKTPPRP